jgi:hypothetical protein
MGRNKWRRGKDLNPRVVLPTATSKLAAALANGDLSTPYVKRWSESRDPTLHGLRYGKQQSLPQPVLLVTTQ